MRIFNMCEKIVLILLLASSALVSAFPRADPQLARARARSFEIPEQQNVTEDSTQQQISAADKTFDVCSLPAVNPSPIACLGAFPKWTFNSKTQICEQFIYGGCGGTKNLFSNEYECLRKCNSNALLLSESRVTNETESSPCLLPLAEGNCRAQISSFYFDQTSGLCSAFVYTGCKGNANNFMSLEDCQQMCRDHIRKPVKSAVTLPALVTPSDDGEMTEQKLCSLPPIKPSPFSCLAFIPSWTFNSSSGRCESYIYGGCGKTANLFQSEEICKATCAGATAKARQIQHRDDSCILPIAKGPCFGHAQRYAFIKEKNRCEVFTFGGCQGNKNNFRSANECFEACGGNLPSTMPECEHAICPISNQRYLERGCLPEYKDNACCPTSFRCPEEKATAGVCHYRGVSYKVGDELTQITEDSPCKTNCRCVESAEHRGGAKIECDQIFCDEPFLPPGKTGCILVSSFDSCCPSYKCDGDELEAGKVASNQICIENDKEYKIDQYIRSGEPCKTCRCVPGFNGLNENSCREIHCVVDNRIGCVPVYVDGVCCPISYKCAEKSDLNRIIQAETTPGKQGVSTLPIRITDDSDSSRIISVQPETGKQGVSTLPIRITDDSTKDPRCLLPKLVGFCKMSAERFYYDTEQQQCISFIYGGCKGNENNFVTLEECASLCGGAASQSRALNPTSVSDDCSLPMAIGPCRGSVPSFFFNSEKSECDSFWFGGCKGNANRFETLEACQSRCLSPAKTLRTKAVTQEDDSHCKLPADIGPCRGAKDRYHYDSATGDCKQFIFGGCRGNKNNFHTIEECRGQCKKNVLATPTNLKSSARMVEARQPQPQEDAKLLKCVLPADPGFCRGYAQRYFYDSQNKVCKTFVWGGCLGNANNFVSEQDCMSACHLQVQPVAFGAGKGARLIGARVQGMELSPNQLADSHKDLLHSEKESVECHFGNLTLNLGDIVLSDDPCEECICSTPPEMSCTQKTCPSPPEGAVCKMEYVSGQCCPSFSCVSANPPFIDVCAGVECKENEHCKVESQETDDGSWAPPKGVCVEVNCAQETCPPPLKLNNAVCRSRIIPGQCCPSYECVSANPPFIDVCAGVDCKENERCKVESQETADGSWAPPKGVCVEKSDADDCEGPECLIDGGVLDNLFKEK